MLLDFRSYSLAVNLTTFGAAAVIVWMAGSRLAWYADAIATRTNLSRAFVALSFSVALVLLADLVYRGGPILATADRSALFAGAIGMVVTGVFLVGLLERRNRTVFGMGIDSVAVLITYATGLAGLYALR